MKEYMIAVSVIVPATDADKAEQMVRDALNWKTPEYDILDVMELD